MKKTAYVLSALFFLIITLLLIGNKSISTEIEINAPAHKVWNELMNVSQYSEWNPFIKKLTGQIKKGTVIEVIFQTKEKGKINSMTFTPEIILLKENSILQWQGRLLMPGIFTGKHTFQLVKIGKNKTRFIQKEDFNGILVSLFSFKSTIEGFTSMNKALKERIERKKVK